ncbi:hypothetical protein BD414DRAFT_477318 [Trametes punicea]|nr:hypothetical protein BD414DRAFT_477318 [Trametes punicea]
MVDPVLTRWAVLYKPPDAKHWEFVSLVCERFFPTDTLDSILPVIFQEDAVVRHLSCTTPEKFCSTFYLLPERQVDALAPRRQQRDYFENICNASTFEGYCPRLSPHCEFYRVKAKPNNFIVLLELRQSGCSQSRAPHLEVYDQSQHREIIALVAQMRRSPFTEAQLEGLHITQTLNVIDAIYNGRPLPLSGVPTTIYNSAFTNFLRVLKDDDIESTPTELMHAAKFIEGSVQYYQTKATRVRNMATTMDLALGYDILQHHEIPLSSGMIRLDGAVKASVKGLGGPQRPLLCITEAKCEIGEDGCDPMAQAERDYRAFYCSDEAETVRASCCCPCLLIGIASPRIMVSGAVFADTLHVQELSGYRSFVPRPTLSERSAYDECIHEAGRFFRAIKAALDELSTYYASLELLPTVKDYRMSVVSPARARPYIGPQWTQFKMGDKTVTLTYTGRLFPDQQSKAVFTAVASVDGAEATREVIVKLLANHQTPQGTPRPFAPKLWFCEVVESVGKYGVERNMTVDDCAMLHEAVGLLHERGLIVGDLRERTLWLLKGGGVMLVNFDWCGKEGAARYPDDIHKDRTTLWHPNAKVDHLIKKEHDLHLLAVLAERSLNTDNHDSDNGDNGNNGHINNDSDDDNDDDDQAEEAE